MIEAELDSLNKRAQNYLDSIPPETDPILTTMLHRYLCVLISSNIDKAIHLILTAYATQRGSVQLAHYVSRRYVRGTNYNTQRIITALSLFDAQWGAEFEQAVSDADLKERIDSIYSLRNAVAHGELPNISGPSVRGYFDVQMKVVALIKKIVLG